MAAAHRTAPLLKPHDELRRELAAPAENVAPRLVDDIQLLAVEGFHFKVRLTGDAPRLFDLVCRWKLPWRSRLDEVDVV